MCLRIAAGILADTAKSPDGCTQGEMFDTKFGEGMFCRLEGEEMPDLDYQMYTTLLRDVLVPATAAEERCECAYVEGAVSYDSVVPCSDCAAVSRWQSVRRSQHSICMSMKPVL
eukprot:GFYU01059544.1.p1 GENE.GFYU01059544.1~~GFYU01059544.1.p1  ORF type:complete len:114 (+),score=11.04 GFYU01059544.1:596-937(+)